MNGEVTVWDSRTNNPLNYIMAHFLRALSSRARAVTRSGEENKNDIYSMGFLLAISLLIYFMHSNTNANKIGKCVFSSEERTEKKEIWS